MLGKIVEILTLDSCLLKLLDTPNWPKKNKQKNNTQQQQNKQTKRYTIFEHEFKNHFCLPVVPSEWFTFFAPNITIQRLQNIQM